MKLEDEISQKKFRNEYHKAAVNLLFTFSWLRSYQEKIFKPRGITGQQFNILRILRGQHPKPANIKLIRERMLDRMSDCSRIVEKLRAKGLIERNICPADRRHVDVIITNKGLDLLSKLDLINEESDKFLSNLDEKEVSQLNRLLDKLRG
ncbi:MAG: MarR family winged helix-turn-helix transcriptional regulator [Ignavibacteriaceae bacterium]|jgi:DNA-binding MarR family transcriptional regulator